MVAHFGCCAVGVLVVREQVEAGRGWRRSGGIATAACRTGESVRQVRQECRVSSKSRSGSPVNPLLDLTADVPYPQCRSGG